MKYEYKLRSELESFVGEVIPQWEKEIEKKLTRALLDTFADLVCEAAEKHKLKLKENPIKKEYRVIKRNYESINTK